MPSETSSASDSVFKYEKASALQYVPNASTSGNPERIEAGMAVRGKNHTRIAVDVHSIA